MLIPIIRGVYTDMKGDVRLKFPVNMMPIIESSGVSESYLKPAYGIKKQFTGLGKDRGGINWEDSMYRVSGNSLVKINANEVFSIIGNVTNDLSTVKMDYSFDRLAVVSTGNLYYYDGIDFSQVTDEDLGNVIDIVWIDGYFMLTDGKYIIVTDISDPFSINPLKYGSSEVDPDPIYALKKLRNEVYVCNRYTIEIFDNVGGSGFPFQRIDGAQIHKGVVGTDAVCVFRDFIAFVGSGRNEAPSVYIAQNAVAQRISNSEIDKNLQSLSEDELSKIKIETVFYNNQDLLIIHLPSITYVYDGIASQILKAPIWFVLSSSIDGKAIYKGINFVFFNQKYFCGNIDTGDIGFLDKKDLSHFGEIVGWEFSTAIIYNENKGAIINSLELVSLTGRNDLNTDSTIWSSYSNDGMSWSQRKPLRIDSFGNTSRRLVWRRQGYMRRMRIQRFNGTSDAKLSVLGLDITAEGLNG